MDKQRIDAFCRKWVGVPFLERGRSTYGIDCWGLVREFLMEMGYDLPDFDYHCGDHALLIAKELHNHVQPIDKVARRCGDLLGFDSANRGELSHIAICLGGDRFIHARRYSGVAQSWLYLYPYWRLLTGVYRVKEQYRCLTTAS